MNKGIKMSSGEVIGILNADDFYASNEIIKTVVKEIKEKNVDSYWGDLVYVDKENLDKIIRYWKSSEYKEGTFKTGWYPPHPTFLLKNGFMKNMASLIWIFQFQQIMN